MATKIFVLVEDDDDHGMTVAEWGKVFATRAAAEGRIDEMRKDHEKREAIRRERLQADSDKQKAEHNALLLAGLRDAPFREYTMREMKFYPPEIEEWDVEGGEDAS